MKITMPLKQLKDAVEKSSLGALTKDAQDEDRKKIKPTDSCVKISASKDAVTFESSSKEVSALHSIPVRDDVVVEKEGICCADAKSYLKMLKTLPTDCSVQISYEANKDCGKDPYENIVIKPNGKLTTIAFKNKSEKTRGTNDTYPVGGFTQVDYSRNQVLFSINAKLLKQCVSQVIFAICPKNLSNIYDNVAIYALGNKIHFAGTDGKRCAIYSVDADEKDAAIILDGQKILIDGKLLKDFCKCFGKGEIIDVIGCEDNGHVVLATENTKIRLQTASKEAKRQFPNAINLLDLACPTTITVDKSDFLSAIEFLSLCNLSLCNPDKSIFYVEQGKSEIKINATRRGTEPGTALVKCEPIKASLANPVAMSNRFIQDCCKRIVGSWVKISFSLDEKKTKMESTTDKRFVHFMQSMTVE